MGIDKSLSDRYPSVIINGMKYQYGKSPQDEEFLVEHASIAKDYWCFKHKEDLQAFLINLPESADHRRRISAAYPDWSSVTHEQRDTYLKDDRLKQRALAGEKVRAGTAQSFNMDLEGEHGPYEPQEIRRSGQKPPDIRPATRSLIDAVKMDAWPSNATITDFGIDSQQHYEALYHPIREGEISPDVLDDAMGHGQRLTMLVREAPSNPHKEVEFYTAWDGMAGRPPFDPTLTKETLDAQLDSLRGELKREIEEVHQATYVESEAHPAGWEEAPGGVAFREMSLHIREATVDDRIDFGSYIDRGMPWRELKSAMRDAAHEPPEPFDRGPSQEEAAREAAKHHQPSREMEMEP